jgi:hypothetical protein
MRRIQLLAAALLVFVLASAIACNGDEDVDDTPSDSATATAEPTNGDAPNGTVTPAPDKSPIDGNGDVPTGDGQPSTNGDATPAPGGTPATFVEDISDWLATNYPGVSPQNEDCIFNPGTFITTCPPHGDYSVDPPLTGEDVTCQSLLVNDEPVAINCRSQDPLQSIYYEVQQ